jgi:hypothetical protein
MRPKFTNIERTCIEVIENGKSIFIPVDVNNKDYQRLVEMDVEIEEYQEPIDHCKQKANEEIRILAEKMRASAINDQPAKILVYEKKPEIAKGALAGDQECVALLQREANARGETVEELATLIVNNEKLWTIVAFELDAIEEEAQAAIEVADTIEEIQYAMNYASEEFMKAMSKLG